MTKKKYKVHFGFDTVEVEAFSEEDAATLAKAQRIKSGLDTRYQKIEEATEISEQVFLAEGC